MKQSPQSAVPSRRASPLNHTVPAPLFKEHKSAEEIAYSPEAALEEGVKMIQTLKARMQNLKLGSKLREEVWAREISRFVFHAMTDSIAYPHVVSKIRAPLLPLLPFVAVCYFYLISQLALIKGT